MNDPTTAGQLDLPLVDRDFIVLMAKDCEHRAARALAFRDVRDYETSVLYEIAAERASRIAFDVAGAR
ncbi:hypothetical protein [Rhodanobacter sp. KK11]|jgi:hypothetical protein|uniref:hypothetical protein n=1 Tax=Rhodanobacter sp. KK11 TaxID=3083255 RepID=UPI002965EC46|nr:hypothetical protein [Rhodanobacter sp. KK11]MDW2981734.1 hypothetical protein [Rhodanobacter sp. KK11]